MNVVPVVQYTRRSQNFLVRLRQGVRPHEVAGHVIEQILHPDVSFDRGGDKRAGEQQKLLRLVD